MSFSNENPIPKNPPRYAIYKHDALKQELNNRFEHSNFLDQPVGIPVGDYFLVPGFVSYDGDPQIMDYYAFTGRMDYGDYNPYIPSIFHSFIPESYEGQLIPTYDIKGNINPVIQTLYSIGAEVKDFSIPSIEQLFVNKESPARNRYKTYSDLFNMKFSDFYQYKPVKPYDPPKNISVNQRIDQSTDADKPEWWDGYKNAPTLTEKIQAKTNHFIGEVGDIAIGATKSLGKTTLHLAKGGYNAAKDFLGPYDPNKPHLLDRPIQIITGMIRVNL